MTEQIKHWNDIDFAVRMSRTDDAPYMNFKAYEIVGDDKKFLVAAKFRSRSCKPSLMSSSGQLPSYKPVPDLRLRRPIHKQTAALPSYKPVPDLLYLAVWPQGLAMLSSLARMSFRTAPWLRLEV